MISKYGVPISDQTDERAPVIQPKFKNRFRVFFYNFGATNTVLSGVGTQGAVKTDKESIALTGNVSNFTKPTVNFAQNEVRSFIGRGNVAGRPTWDNVSLSLRDDIKNAALKFIMRQSYLQTLKYVPSSSVFGRNFTFSMVVEIMDGRVGHTGIERWFFTGCSLASVNYGELSYENEADIQKLDLNVMYNNVYVSSPRRIKFASSHAYNEKSVLNQGPLAEAQEGFFDKVYGVIDNATDAVVDTMDTFIDEGTDFVNDKLGDEFEYLENKGKEAYDTAGEYFGKGVSTANEYIDKGVDYTTGTIKGIF